MWNSGSRPWGLNIVKVGEDGLEDLRAMQLRCLDEETEYCNGGGAISGSEDKVHLHVGMLEIYAVLAGSVEVKLGQRPRTVASRQGPIDNDFNGSPEVLERHIFRDGNIQHNGGRECGGGIKKDGALSSAVAAKEVGFVDIVPIQRPL